MSGFDAAGTRIAICSRHSCYWLAACHQSTCKHMPACVLVPESLSQVCVISPVLRISQCPSQRAVSQPSLIWTLHGPWMPQAASGADLSCRSVWSSLLYVHPGSFCARRYSQSPLLRSCTNCSTAQQTGIKPCLACTTCMTQKRLVVLQDMSSTSYDKLTAILHHMRQIVLDLPEGAQVAIG